MAYANGGLNCIYRFHNGNILKSSCNILLGILLCDKFKLLKIQFECAEKYGRKRERRKTREKSGQTNVKDAYVKIVLKNAADNSSLPWLAN